MKFTDNHPYILQKIEEIDTILSGVTSGSPKGVYATLAALKSAKPLGDTYIYIVKADGNWYYWNNVDWVSGGVYQSTPDIDGKIKVATFTAGSTPTSRIVHNLSFNPAKDDLQVFYYGILLEVGSNYTLNADNIAVDLVGWTISKDEKINFKLYKNVK